MIKKSAWLFKNIRNAEQTVKKGYLPHKNFIGSAPFFTTEDLLKHNNRFDFNFNFLLVIFTA